MTDQSVNFDDSFPINSRSALDLGSPTLPVETSNIKSTGHELHPHIHHILKLLLIVLELIYLHLLKYLAQSGILNDHHPPLKDSRIQLNVNIP
jgi:hypothetical protein